LKTRLTFLVTLALLTGSAWAMPLDSKDFTFGYWLNGWRKHEGDASRDILCIETGHYGLTFDVSDLTQVTFGERNDALDYVAALEGGAERLAGLAPAELTIEVENEGSTYRAVSCQAGIDRGVARLKHARLWESGRFVQHFDLLGLVFKDAHGNRLDCNSRLVIVAWPDSFAITVTVEPLRAMLPWADATLRLRLKQANRSWSRETRMYGGGGRQRDDTLVLVCDVKEPASREGVSVKVTPADNRVVNAVFDPVMNSYVARIRDIRRRWRVGYTDIRHYDDIRVHVDNKGRDGVKIPLLIELKDVANVTGVCPILCDAAGVPTGIPVQLSKNWHYAKMGTYLRAFALLPAASGASDYMLRIIYGFYGTLPSASHAQLSLVGYGGHGRWEQLAIGCWGETMCFDMDLSCVDNTITDVRALMARNGLHGRTWNWTDAGWGGDWLHALDARGQKLYFSEMKTAYVAHGPCLSEVRYDGAYGSKREVDVSVVLRTLRTDDYARTFQTLRYRFNAGVPMGKGGLFKMGHRHYVMTPKVAYGHRDGLLAEASVDPGATVSTSVVEHVELPGNGPWWVAFPGSVPRHRKWGTASRALVIRGYRATFGGRTSTAPSISMPVALVRKNMPPSVSLSLVPPRGVTAFQPGDTVEMDLEWITPPRVADDYYGPNDAFRQHLAQNPRSWKTVYREVAGNDLKVQVAGGALLNRYPVIIRAESDTVTVDIEGGVGYVPIRFEGMKAPTGHVLSRKVGDQLTPLDQSVHGNDFWQTDYDPASKRYKVTYNLPLDGLQKSTWVLKRK